MAGAIEKLLKTLTEQLQLIQEARKPVPFKPRPELIKATSNGQWQILEKAFVNKKIPQGTCDCGSHATGSEMHSDWCGGLKPPKMRFTFKRHPDPFRASKAPLDFTGFEVREHNKHGGQIVGDIEAFHTPQEGVHDLHASVAHPNSCACQLCGDLKDADGDDDAAVEKYWNHPEIRQMSDDAEKALAEHLKNGEPKESSHTD